MKNTENKGYRILIIKNKKINKKQTQSKAELINFKSKI